MFIRVAVLPAEDQTTSRRESNNPAEIDPAHARGWWTTRTDWAAFAAGHAQVWRVLPRLEWLAPRRHEGGGGEKWKAWRLSMRSP